MEEKNSNLESAELIIDNILAYSQSNGDLLNKYNLDFYLNHFDRHHLLALASGLPPHRPLTQADFLRLLLLHIPHPPEETLYLALSLHSLFQAVLERTATASLTIDFSDFTTYLCQKISKEDLDLVVPGQQIVECPKQSPEVSLDAPLMLSRVEHQIPKISRELARKNKKLEEKRTVGKMFYNAAEEKILAVGSLSSTVHLFDLKLNAVGDIRPKECKELDKEVGILSIGYNVSNNRIGAILTSGTLVFWEGSDNFTTQKSIAIRNYGDKVYFLEQAACWVTVSSNTIYFWDLKEEVVTSSLHIPEASSILDICQITHLRSLCLSIVGPEQNKFIGVYYEGKRKAVIDFGSAACHSLHYHPGTRTLLPLTYTSSPQIWTIQDLQFDPQLKFVLRGHKSIVTCADSIPDSSILLTGDDAGQIRVWELNYMRCLQSVKLTRWLGGIKLIKDHLLYSDSRINLLPLEQLVPPRPEKEIPIQLSYQPQQKMLWLFTRKEARRVEFLSGRAKEIYQIVEQENQISAAVCVGDGFVVGLSNGSLMRFNSDVHLTWSKQAHEGQIKQLLYDSQNRLIWSLGADGKAMAWPQRNPQVQIERKVISFKRKSLALLAIAQSSTLLVTAHSMDKQLTLWDYQNLALLEVLEMETPVLAVTLSQTIELMAVASADSPIVLFKYKKKQHILELIKLAELELIQLIPTSLLLSHSSDFTQHTVTVATSQGYLLTFDISPLILRQYSQPEEMPIRESVNILRNQREQFESSYNQRGHTQPYDLLPEATDLIVSPMWTVQIGKQSLLCLNALNSESVGVLSGQYCKIVQKKTGNIAGSLNVSQPLPIRWNKMSDKREELKQRLYATLKTLDNILTNHGYQMLARQYKMVNITSFMDLMKNVCIRPTADLSLPPLTSDRPLAHPPTSPKETSLKTLQAYKRVKAIKKISQESMEMPLIPPVLEPQLQRDSFLQMLAPDSYSDLLSKYTVQKDPHMKALSAKLTESLSQKAVRLTMKQNRRQFMDRSSIREGALKELGKNHKQSWIEKSQHKTIKTILGDLNNKLRQCRLKHSKDTEQ